MQVRAYHGCDVVAVEVALLTSNRQQVVADVSVSLQDDVTARSDPVEHLQQEKRRDVRATQQAAQRSGRHGASQSPDPLEVNRKHRQAQ